MAPGTYAAKNSKIYCQFCFNNDSSSLSKDTSERQNNMYKHEYCQLYKVMSNLDYDIKHGVRKEDVTEFLDKIRKSPEKEFTSLR